MMITYQESFSTGYKERTYKNASADVTIAFAVDFTTSGEVLTKRCVKEQGCHYIAIDANNINITDERVEKLIARFNKVSAKTLNIAGNGMYTLKKRNSKLSQQDIDEFVYGILSSVILSEKLVNKIESIRSGGQTGFDEAGIKAAVRLKIPAIVHFPKGWKFRGENGVDVTDEIQFKKRFELG